MLVLGVSVIVSAAVLGVSVLCEWRWCYVLGVKCYVFV